MKKLSQKTVVMLLIAAVVLTTSLAIAGNVANTKHNFSIGGGSNSFQANSINQVCVFCHTPHNAGMNKFLWNKSNLSATTPSSFRLYTSSSTLSASVKGLASTPGLTSLLCLGCHDGKTAMNVMHTTPAGANVQAAPTYTAGSYFIEAQGANGFNPVTMPPGAYNFGSGTYDPSNNLGMTSVDPLAGDNLTDDHPIGFSYSNALTDPGQAALLQTVAYAQARNIRFFGPTNKVECSSCHDPHVDYSAAGNPALKPFLVTSNSGSALCLSCHNK